MNVQGGIRAKETDPMDATYPMEGRARGWRLDG
jgi:hypothetical protein